MADLQTLLNKFLAALYGGFGTGIAYNPSGVINANVTPVANPSINSEDILMSYSLGAGALSANGMGVRVTAWGTTAANTNSKTVRIYFGATSVSAITTTTSGVSWHISADVLRVTATTQTAAGLVFITANVGNPFVSTPGETLSGAVVIKVTGLGVTAANDITATGLIVEALP